MITKELANEALDAVIDGLQKSNINLIDKVEIMINLRLFFESYDENIQVLESHRLVKAWQKTLAKKRGEKHE